MKKIKITEKKVTDFLLKLSPWNYLEIKRALEVTMNCNMSIEELVEEINNYVENCETQIKDIVALSYAILMYNVNEIVKEHFEMEEYIEINPDGIKTEFNIVEDKEEMLKQKLKELPHKVKTKLLKTPDAHFIFFEELHLKKSDINETN